MSSAPLPSGPQGSPLHGPDSGHGPARESCPPNQQVLIVANSADRRMALTRMLRSSGDGSAHEVICGLAESAETALGMLGAPAGPPRFELVVFDLPRCSPQALRFVRALGERKVATVLVCPSVSFDEAVEAMRAGASDIVSATIKPGELLRRVRSALAQRRNARWDERRAAAVEAGLDPSGEPPAPLPLPPAASAPRTKATRVKPGDPKLGATMADGSAVLINEFATQIRAELDVESLLRQGLEFVLRHVGPTNGAIFLPSTTGDFSLGAYVNYTCPKETAEVLLDHLANVAAPRLESGGAPVLLTDRQAVRGTLGEGLDWLEDGHVMGIPCRDGPDCLAVVLLFRERTAPFTAADMALLTGLARVFAAQLARVVRIHHRHLPRDKWGALGDPMDSGDDQGGMAA